MRGLVAVAVLTVGSLALAAPGYANVTFGDAGSIPGDCHQGGPPGAEGLVCAASESFANGGGGSITATEGGGAVLTDKPVATAGFMDSGLGVADSAANCDDVLCEAEVGQSVAAAANGTKISDAVVGSLDPTESFNFLVDGHQINSAPIAATACNGPNFTSIGPLTCQWTDPTGVGVDMIEMATASGSAVLSEVSTPSAGPPGLVEPGSLGLLGVALGGFGLAWLNNRRRPKRAVPGAGFEPA